MGALVSFLFIYFFNDIGSLYSLALVTLLKDLGVSAAITSSDMGNTFALLSGLQQYYITLSGNSSLIIPVLMFQKLIFVVVMLSIGLGLHIDYKKKLNYLLVVPAYWAFVMLQDVLVNAILGQLNMPVDTTVLGAVTLITSSQFGSLILLYAIFHTAALPPPIDVKPKIKRDYKKYYYALGISTVLAVAIIYLSLPVFHALEQNFAIALMMNVILISFKMNWYAIGLVFSSLDKPLRSRLYAPSVTIIIPVYNESDVIVANLDACEVAASKYKGKVEVIVVNDRSKDNTHQICEERIRKFKNVDGKVVLGEGKGKSHALNLALGMAQGEMILNIDADVVLAPDAISELVPYFVDPTVGGVGCHVDQKDERGFFRRFFVLDLLYMFGLVRAGQDGYDSVMAIAGAIGMFRRKILLELGGWAIIKRGEDGDITIRVARSGYRILHYKSKALAYSEIPDETTPWFRQRTRWLMAFFYVHSRNRGMISMKQGVRGTYLMPLLYSSTFTRFTSSLHADIILLMGIASFIVNGFASYSAIFGSLPIILPTFVILLAMAIHHKKTYMLPYFPIWLAYSFLVEYASFRAFINVLGDEEWETRSLVQRDNTPAQQ